MSNANESLSIQQYQGLVERVTLCTLTTLPCCVFLFINATMLFTLRSKAVFCDTSRYILLFNLLFADTVQMALCHLLYVIAACRVTLTYPVCGLLNMLAVLTNDVSPLTLVAMSLERYVAVCYPLRHATIITVRNTGVAVIVVWAFSSLNVLTRVFLILQFAFKNTERLQMKEFCSDVAMLLDSVSYDYNKAYTCFLFVSAGVVIASSFLGVMTAARSVFADKASAQKNRNTLLLHLVQLGLTLSSTVLNPVLTAISTVVTRIVLVRVHIVFYMCFCIFPRCLSSLIYGVKDQTIRPVLMHYLCCQLKFPVVSAKT
ncbi:hypothetical protein Q5P01_018993 [Channa striata]|uniref:G-protein coupled receptors family 1 profile domain-containing protein n=1 Tax=Channa striata TaxID=64152 RepID=A0AA88M0L0_CHASR|nr:hypothetical protein Q5P01_018993 [Channa striata]